MRLKEVDRFLVPTIKEEMKMKRSIFAILLTLIAILIFCGSCGQNAPEVEGDKAQTQAKPDPNMPGPKTVLIHFNSQTHEIERVIVAGNKRDPMVCPDGVPAGQCFQEQYYPDAKPMEPLMNIDAYEVNPTYCVIYDTRGNKYFVPCP